jgi:hypothetical protein
MRPKDLFPLRRKAFALKNPKASAGFEPAKLGTRGQHASSRPPKPLSQLLVQATFLITPAIISARRTSGRTFKQFYNTNSFSLRKTVYLYINYVYIYKLYIYTNTHVYIYIHIYIYIYTYIHKLLLLILKSLFLSFSLCSRAVTCNLNLPILRTRHC